MGPHSSSSVQNGMRQGDESICLVQVSVAMNSKTKEKMLILKETQDPALVLRDHDGEGWSEINPLFLMETIFRDKIVSVDRSGKATISTIYWKRCSL